MTTVHTHTYVRTYTYTTYVSMFAALRHQTKPLRGAHQKYSEHLIPCKPYQCVCGLHTHAGAILHTYDCTSARQNSSLYSIDSKWKENHMKCLLQCASIISYKIKVYCKSLKNIRGLWDFSILTFQNLGGNTLLFLHVL